MADEPTGGNSGSQPAADNPNGSADPDAPVAATSGTASDDTTDAASEEQAKRQAEEDELRPYEAPVTDNDDIESLLWWSRWPGSGVTFSFPAAAEQYDYFGKGPETRGERFLAGFEPLSEPLRDAVRTALGAGTRTAEPGASRFGSVTELTGLEISEVSGGAGDMRFGFSPAEPNGWGYNPEPNGAAGDVFINRSVALRNAAPAPGNYLWHLVHHEIGARAGPAHAHETRKGSGKALRSELDSPEYTVMTYRNYVGDIDLSDNNIGLDSFAQTFMMLDIQALQHLYGANYNTRSGSTTYSWNPATGELSIDGIGQGAPSGNRIFATVWDGGGNDTYDLSAYTSDLAVDLRPGRSSLFAVDQLADLGDGKSAGGNIYNALLHQDDERSLIENVQGGSGNDTLIGNQTINRLSGGAGDDRLVGGGGRADLLDGGAGIDTVDYSASPEGVALRLDGVGSGGEARGDMIIRVENVVGSAFDDVVIGSASDNLMNGGTGSDVLHGEVGVDTLDGGDGDDKLSGGFDNDSLHGGAGDDTLDGGSSEGYLPFGSRQDADNLSGGDGNDTLFGNYADDVLSGDAGDDTLEGGEGNDRFAFNGTTWGHDVIIDFSPGPGSPDQIQFTTDLFNSFSAVMDAASDSADGVVIAAQGVSLRLKNVAKADLSEQDFVFVAPTPG